MALDSETLLIFQKIKSEQLTKATNSILKSTIQFYTNSKEGNPRAFGSGLLLTLKGRYFMVTAAHVIAEHHENIFLILPDCEQRLGGRLVSTAIPTLGYREDDSTDLSAMELTDKKLIDLLQKHHIFLKRSDLSIAQRHSTPQYLSVGFPGSETKYHEEEKELEANPYPVQSEVAENFNYEKVGISFATHIAIKFEGEVVSASNPTPHSTPHMGGISGSGLWHNGNYLKDDPTIAKRLVGIVIEQQTVDGQTVLIATRTAVVLEFMRLGFQLNIPPSTTIKVVIGTK